MQEYLRLSDVYRMYRNASLQPHSSTPAALHCLSRAVAPGLPCEVDILPALSDLCEILSAPKHSDILLKHIYYRCSVLTYCFLPVLSCFSVYLFG